jgi:branched-chain amino acid transport system ATP-binding protein
MNREPALLSVDGVVVRYGAVAAVRGVDLQVHQGEVVTIVGPNGAGKTSLLSAIAGIVKPASGSITYRGGPLSQVPLEDVVRTGIALVPEGRHIFATLSVQENLLLGATIRDDVTEVRSDVARLYRQFPILAARAGQPAGHLSGGEQQQLAIARALLSRPRLLLLDEPSLGLAPAIIDQVYRLLRSIHEDGVTILLVEQNAERAFSISDRAYVMNGGAVTLRGTAAELATHANFDAAYFGISMREARNAG